MLELKNEKNGIFKKLRTSHLIKYSKYKKEPGFSSWLFPVRANVENKELALEIFKSIDLESYCFINQFEMVNFLANYLEKYFFISITMKDWNEFINRKEDIFFENIHLKWINGLNMNQKSMVINPEMNSKISIVKTIWFLPANQIKRTMAELLKFTSFSQINACEILGVFCLKSTNSLVLIY